MFRRQAISLICFTAALCGGFLAIPAQAAIITVQGAIRADDAITLFSFTVGAPGSVDIRSYGYAGGITSNGITVPGGGFDTVLTLFNSAGLFINDNDAGSGVAVDPGTGLAEDARITTNLAAGKYILVLTQYDNFSLGDLADGFVETGNPHFTADPSFSSGGACPGDVFRDISGSAGRCRSGNWTVNFSNVSSAAVVPEPAAVLLGGLGLALLMMCRRSRLKGAGHLSATLFLLAAASAQAQTNQQDPDYSGVSDFLNGQRTLLQVSDIQIWMEYFGLGPTIGTVKTSNSQQTFAGGGNPVGFYDNSKPLRTFSAQMFNQTGAVTLSPFYDFNNTALLTLWIQNVVGVTNNVLLWTPLDGGDEPDITAGAVADFNQDGFEELALSFADGRMLVIGPNDVNDPTKGFRKTVTKLNILGDLIAGDFDGDGKQELAGLTVMPNGGLNLTIYTVDTATLAVTQASSLVLTTSGTGTGNPITAYSMARGRFNTAGHDQIALTFTTAAGPAIAEIVDFPINTLTPVEKPQLIASSSPTPFGYLQVKTGKFALPGNPYDQIVFHQSSGSSNGRFFSIVTADPTSLVLTGGHPMLPYDQFPCAAGIQVGNFDHRDPDPNTVGSTIPNPNSQVAFLYCTGTQDGEMGWDLNIYSIDPTTLSPVGESQVHLPYTNNISFAASDVQGRSLVLGQPTVITIDSAVQPSVVVGAPPMHIDFVSPNPGQAPPMVMNLSAATGGFFTTFTQNTSDGTKSSSSGTTSWSFGLKESANASLSVGDPDSDGLKVSDTISAGQKLKGSVDTANGSFNGKKFDLSNTTGFGDEVSFVDNQFNIWVYPVIGKTACPSTNPTCTVKQPVTVQFSATSGDPTPQAAQGQSVQWYQPPWEPGNIFSYPPTFDALNAIYPNLTKLATGVEFLTDSSRITQSTQWTVSDKDSSTTALSQNYSFENDLSVTSAAGLTKTIDVGAGFDLNISGSYGLSTLNKTATTLASSTGVQVSKPGSFKPVATYGYSVTPYIMGTTMPGGTVDNHPLKADVQTFGVVRALFTANPQSSTSGGWWTQAYNRPDVALNHPARWNITNPGLTNPIPPNCLASGTGSSDMDCAELSQRLPNNPWLSPYHQMRGFFISSAASPGQGPQLESAKAGDVLSLQARVYNYSFQPMPTGTTVHVRFYFAPWSQTLATGDSVLIEEKVLDPIAPFDYKTTVPNWVLASTTFDTSKYAQTKTGDVSVAFWVVVWMQSPSGQLVTEMPGHGLTGIPGTLKSLADVAEECQIDDNSNTNCYSNNVGFYKQAFYIASPSLLTAPGPIQPTSLDVSKVDFSANPIALKDNVTITASLLASGGAASSVSALIYDGDPSQGGRLVTAERLPHVAPNKPHLVQVPFRTNKCGVHQLFVVVNKGKPTQVIRRAAPLRVTCPGQ